MKKEEAGRSSYLTVPLYAVLFAAILILVIFSAVSYRRSVQSQNYNNQMRALLSYVTTAVEAASGEQVELAERGGRQALIIPAGGTGYEQQIYFADGRVLESFMPAGQAPNEADAVEVGESSVFEMRWFSENLLEITTDAGVTYVHAGR